MSNTNTDQNTSTSYPKRKNIVSQSSSKLIISLHDYIVQFQTTTGMEGVPHTGVIAQDVQKVLPDAVSSGGQMFLSNGEEIGDMLIVNKDRLFLGNSYQKISMSKTFLFMSILLQKTWELSEN